MIAVVPVRDGVLPAGAEEAVAECAGRVVLAGSGTAETPTAGLAREVVLVELGSFAPARWTATLAPLLDRMRDDVVVLPASADGRDLAPRLATAMGRPLFAGADRVTPTSVSLTRRGGFDLVRHVLDGPAVATLQPGVRAADAVTDTAPVVDEVTPGPATDVGPDPRSVEVLAPDLATMDLAEAERIVGGGAGLDDAARFDQLERFAAAIGATTGATRVVTDRSWVPHQRQIGTTGVVVDPVLYLSFGISGAVQHTSGLGDPDHVLSVNTDPHCPMMQMSDLAIVSDANAVLDELDELLAPTPAEAAGG